MIFAALLSSYLLLVWSYSSLQVDAGEKKLMITNTGHILESSSILPRSITVDLSFSKVFNNPPQVFIQTQYMDWEQHLPGGFILQVSFITTKGFKIIVIAVSPQPLYQVFVNWFAFDDHRIQVLSFETDDVQQLKTGIGERMMSYQVGHDLKDASNGIIGIMGIKHTADQPRVEFKIQEITISTITFSARSYLNSQLEYIKVVILLGTDQSLWSSSALYMHFSQNDLFFTRSPGYIFEAFTCEYPLELNKDGNFPLITIRGYDVGLSDNFRVFQGGANLDTSITYTVQTWWKTQIYSIYNQIAIYKADSNLKVFDPYCAEIFSECYFNGESKLICGGIQDLIGDGWSKPIKSLTIPVPTKLYLYNQKSYIDLKTIYSENKACLDITNNILSEKLQPQQSFIKVLFLNTKISMGCLTVKFYSLCNYQGTVYQISQGSNLKMETKLPFEIKSIEICPNIIVKLRGPQYFGGAIKELISSESCLDGYKAYVKSIHSFLNIINEIFSFHNKPKFYIISFSNYFKILNLFNYVLIQRTQLNNIQHIMCSQWEQEKTNETQQITLDKINLERSYIILSGFNLVQKFTKYALNQKQNVKVVLGFRITSCILFSTKSQKQNQNYQQTRLSSSFNLPCKSWSLLTQRFNKRVNYTVTIEQLDQQEKSLQNGNIQIQKKFQDVDLDKKQNINNLNQERYSKEELQGQDFQLKQQYQQLDYFAIANELEKQFRFEEALSYYDLAIQRYPGQAALYNQKGLVLSKLNRFEDCVKLLETAIQLEPEQAVLHYNKANTLEKLQQYEEASLYYDQAIILDPEQQIFYNKKAQNLINLNLFKEAIVFINFAISKFPTDSKLLNIKGNILSCLNRKEEALQYFELAIQIDPQQSVFYFNMAQTLSEQCYQEKALQYIDFALQRDPGNYYYLNYKTKILIKLNLFEQALQCADVTIQKYPKDTVSRQNKAVILQLLNLFEEALKECDFAIQIDPKDWDLYQTKAVILQKLNRFQEAEQLYDLSIKKIPNNLMIYKDKAQLLNKLNRFEDALGTLDIAIQIYPEEALLYNNKAITLYYLKRCEEALKYHDLAIKKNPEIAIFYSNKALSLKYLGRLEEALQYYEYAIQKNPKDYDIYNQKGIIPINFGGHTLQLLGNFDQALQNFDMAIQLNSEESILYENKADTLKYLDRRQEALENYDIAIYINPQTDRIFAKKAITLSELNLFEEALHFYDIAINFNPEVADYYHNKAQALATIHRLKDALEFSEIAIQKNPENFRFFQGKGNILLKLNRFQEAIQVYDFAIRINSDDAMLYHKKAQALAAINRLEEALEFNEIAIQKNPENFQFFQERGNILQKLNHFEEAIQVYDIAINISPYEAELYSQKGNTFLNLKQFIDAAENFDKAIQLNPNEATFIKGRVRIP